MTATATTRARPRATVVLATAMWAVFVAGYAGTMVLRAMAHRAQWDWFVIPFAAFATVGWLIAVRRPRTVIGWVFLAIGVLTAVGVVSDGVIGLALHRGWQPRGVVMLSAWVQLWFWYPLLVLATAYTMLLFPNGLPSRRWRPVLVLLTLVLSAMVVTAALSPTVEFGKRHLPNPIGIHGNVKDVESTPVFNVAGLVLAACLVASVVSLGVRYRRARGVERAQLKWFFLGAFVLGMTVALSLMSKSFNNSTADSVLGPVSMTVLPLSCGLAVLRYRLYDIDRIVSRAVSYAVVTALLLGVYVGCVALTTTLLSFGSAFGVAASTLAAAAAFQPVRRRVQRAVDRRFDRAAYDARRTVVAFANRLRDQVDVDAVQTDLLATVSSSVAPSSASVWVAT